MNWQQLLQDWGLPVPRSPDFSSIVLALVVVIGAYAIGWFLGKRLGPRIARIVRHWMGRVDQFGDHLADTITNYGLVALLLLVAGNAARFSPLGSLIVAIALGGAVAVIVQRIARAMGVGSGIACVIAMLAFVGTTAGTLGGMQPLLTGMRGVGLDVGTHRITVLGVANFIVVVAVLYVAARLTNRITLHSISRMKALDISQRALVQKLASILVIVVAVLLGVDVLGIDLTALTVFSGAVGIAVGFGLQKTFGNLIAGLILLMDRSVKPGDVIVVGETFGAVTKIGVRAVSVVTRDGKEHLIPNEQLMTQPVENWSYSSRNVRIHIKVGIGYDSDLPLAQRLMIEAALASPRALKEPKPAVWLTGFGDSSVDHEILVWITDPEAGVGNVRSDVLNRLWLSFRENGIEIPFPQRDIHIRSQVPPSTT
ncbi:mechanosensitive ion channel domain-containing protein [Sphingomonas sp. CROZ-RG-20F-R02-07]|uniref:mechanosensitive ion channel family protein n=1 Tax=Sphingomonas sp. CROZ-RG-20F-R02-07 TaxID=2914832 RepID=UPI001F573066|nr:mechanosensitive ion channel domain-containing protein [Sphingomonas sp. CROZ-RG-20F-R02-07]